MDRNLRAFLAVAEAGNLTAAAHRIGLTQPALTKTIRRLEQDFETRLFDRSAKGMGLTAAGRLLFERARLIEMHYQQAHEEIHLQSAGALPEFRIAAGTAYHSAVAPDMVKRLSHEFPGTRFSLDFEVAQNALPRLMDGELDLLLGAFLKVPAEGIETETILKVDMTAYACRTSSLARARRIAPADLAGRRWVVYQRDHLMAGRLQAWCADNMLPEPDIVMQIELSYGELPGRRGHRIRDPRQLFRPRPGRGSGARNAGARRADLAVRIRGLVSPVASRLSDPDALAGRRAGVGRRIPALPFPQVMTGSKLYHFS